MFLTEMVKLVETKVKRHFCSIYGVKIKFYTHLHIFLKLLYPKLETCWSVKLISIYLNVTDCLQLTQLYRKLNCRPAGSTF